jgi:exopolysaccharide biosynthesis polyprenyl glycosylphosphotransferase
MLRRFSVTFAVFSVLLDAALVFLALLLSSVLRPFLNSLDLIAEIPGPVHLPPVLFVLFPVCWVGILISFSIYDGRRYVRASDEFAALSLASILAAVTLAGILYFSFRDISRAQYVLFVVLCVSMLLLWRAVARLFFRLLRQEGPQPVRRVLIVGSGPLGRMVQERLGDGAARNVVLIGTVDDEKADGFQGALLGAISQLAEIVEAHSATDVVVGLPPHFYERISSAVAILGERPVKVWIALGFDELALYRTVTEDLGGLPLIDLRASALDEYERFVKRFFDLVVGTLALLFAIPLILLAAMAIRIGDGGAAFFRQFRVGENGRLFQMYKLRTMIVNAEALQTSPREIEPDRAPIQKQRDDPRVTPVGRVLRRFSIDELPQLLNVLQGDMSLVGPRPELPRLVEKYEPWQRQRLAVPPGMTGWWQVTGRSDKAMHLHTEDDLYYVRNYSIWLDLNILVRTVWTVILGSGAF